MKNTIGFSRLGIAFFAATIGFLMAACPTESGGGGGKNSGPIPLSAGQWKHGELTSATTEVQYSFNVEAGKSYAFWWNDSGEGDGFKTVDIKVSAKWSDGTELSPPISGVDKGWTTSQKITSNTSKTVIITVEPKDSDSIGTYSIAYNIGESLAGALTTYNKPDSTWDKPPANAIPLEENKWKNGTIAGSTIADWGWYTLSVTKDTKYNFWWDEKANGSGMFTGTIGVTAYYSDGKTSPDSALALPEKDTAWTSAQSFTPDRSGTVYIRVRLYNSSFFDDTTYPGTYSIVYSTAAAKPSVNLDDNITAVQLEENTWKHGTLAGTADTDWYKVSVTSGTTYRFWWSDSYQGNIHTGDIAVTGYKKDQTVVITETDSGWNTAKEYTATETGTLYINVKLHTSSTTTPGTYGIVYSTSTTRPVMDLSTVEFINATPLTENIWEDGEITSDGVQWYTMQVSASIHRLWTNDASYGNITKTGKISVTGFYNDGSSAFTRDSGLWSSPKSFTPTKTDTVYIKVTPSNSTSPAGTYGIVYSTTNTRPVVNFDADAASAVTLNVNQWTDGQISAGATDWYKVTVTSGTQYRIYFNDSAQGDNTKTGNVAVYAYYSDWKDIDNDTDGWEYPLGSFTPSANGMVYIRVIPYSSSSGTTAGTYAIVCTTSSSRPLDTQGLSATALTEKQWKTGEFISSNQNLYYKFEASAAGTFYLWWDDANQGGGTGKTASVYVSAYDSGGLTLLTRTSSGYTTAKEIPVTAAGTVYIKVESSYNYNTHTTDGTFSLVYSTTNTRPIDTVGINPIATALSADTWKYGQITSNSSSMYWYTLSVTNGTTYRFWSTYGGVFSPGALVSGYYSDGSSAFAEGNNGNAWATAKSFTSNKDDTVYIRVKSEGMSSSAGIYGIVYSTSTTRPEINVDDAITAAPLTVNQWKNDELTPQNRIFWYSFTVSATGTFYLWTDGYNGSGTMTGDIITNAYNKDGSTTYATINGNAWNSPQQINVNSSANVGKVYIKVEAFSNSSTRDGPFRLAYNTANTRPE
jgi:hypothetical protein